MDDRPICIVHISEDGDIDYQLSGDAVFLVVDERAPRDRVYQMTLQTPRDEIAALISDSPIGSRYDVRHAAVEHRVVRWLHGKSHLAVVDNDA